MCEVGGAPKLRVEFRGATREVKCAHTAAPTALPTLHSMTILNGIPFLYEGSAEHISLATRKYWYMASFPCQQDRAATGTIPL